MLLFEMSARSILQDVFWRITKEARELATVAPQSDAFGFIVDQSRWELLVIVEPTYVNFHGTPIIIVRIMMMFLHVAPQVVTPCERGVTQSTSERHGDYSTGGIRTYLLDHFRIVISVAWAKDCVALLIDCGVQGIKLIAKTDNQHCDNPSWLLTRH